MLRLVTVCCPAKAFNFYSGHPDVCSAVKINRMIDLSDWCSRCMVCARLMQKKNTNKDCDRRDNKKKGLSILFKKTLRRVTHTYVWVNVPRIMFSQLWWGRGFMAVCFWKRTYFCQSIITADITSTENKHQIKGRTSLWSAPVSVNKTTCRLTKKEWKRRGLRQLCQTDWKSIKLTEKVNRQKAHKRFT